MTIVKLTVQPSKNKKFKVFRLGIDKDSTIRLKKHQLITLVLSSKIRIIVKLVCGPPNKKTFDVNSPCLSLWIKSKKFHEYKRGKPTVLEFERDLQNLTFTFKRKLKTSP